MSKVSVGFFVSPNKEENNHPLLTYYWLFRRLCKHCTTSYIDVCLIIYPRNKNIKPNYYKIRIIFIFKFVPLLWGRNILPHFRFQPPITLYLTESSHQNITYLEADMFASRVCFFLASMLLTQIRHYNKTNQGTHTYPLNPDLHRWRHRILEHKSD